jgi:predicted Zn-ribbon and HTH transcriptional regulator
MGSGPLRCESCGATWYSAAAHLLIESQERCPRCESGPLVLAEPEAEEAEGEEDEVRRTS